MKNAILLSTLLLLSCATSYQRIKADDTYADNLNENEDIKIVLGYQGLGSNDRFRDKFEENKISLLRLTVSNKSDRAVTVDANDIVLKIKDEDLAVLPLEASVVANRVELAEAGYWLWGLFWVGYTECTNGDCESTWFPVGLIIGAINFFKASNTNSQMEKELVENSFPGGVINPGEQMSGYLFYDASKKRYYDFQLKYQFDDEDKKLIGVAYSF